MSRITRNITSNVLSFIVSVVIPIFLTPFFIHKLGDNQYGLWILINSVIGYYGLLDLGIGSSIVRYVSKYVAAKDEKNLNSFVNTVFVIFALVGVTIITISVFLSLFLADLFNLPQESSKLFSRLILILGFAVATSFPTRAFGSILPAIQRYDITNAINISCSIAHTGATVYLLSRGKGLIALGLIVLLFRLIDGSLSFIFALRKVPMLKINLRSAEKSKLRTVFSYSVYAFIWRIADQFRFHMDSLVIGAFLSTGAITYYSVGARLMKYYIGIVVAFSSVTTPMFSSMEARDQFGKIRGLLVNGTRYLSLIAIFVGASLILYGKPFIRLWIGEGYDSSYYVMLILVIPYMIALSQSMSLNAAYGIEKHKFLSLVTIGEGVFNLVLSILLVRRYGIYGVAFGTAIPMLIVKLFIQPVYICRVTNLPFIKYVKEVSLPFLAGAIYLVLGKWVISMFQLDSYIRLLFSILVSFAFFAAIAIIFCLTSDERRSLGKLITEQAGAIYSKI